MKKIKVVAAIIREGDKIFATQRGYGEFKGKWEFPGGKIEIGETPEEALVREIIEELDTVISMDKYFETIEYDYPEFHLSMDCFICHIQEGSLILKEHKAAQWLSKDDIDKLDWLPADKELVENLKKII